MSIQPLGIDNVLVAVGDLDRAVEFYVDVLGLSLMFRVDSEGLALFGVGDEAPGVLVRVVEGLEPMATDRMRLWLEVADVQQAYAELVEAGAEIVTEPFSVQTGWTVEVGDPWGTVIGLTDYSLMPERGRLQQLAESEVSAADTAHPQPER